jgi:hypothetical protein
MKKPGGVTVNMVCPRPMKKWLRMEAARLDVSVSELLRQCVSDAMARHPSAK